MKPIRDGVHVRHLEIFVELYRQRSVSRAAEALDVSQPSISVGLARMRDRYRDPLFVRSAGGMLPTPRAEALAQPFARALQLIMEAEKEEPPFVPVSASRRFQVAVTDAGQMIVLPVLVNFLSEASPGISLEVQNITSDTPDAIERGDVELAFGFMHPQRRGLYQQPLFEDRFGCIARTDHPILRTKLSSASFAAAEHVVVASKGTSTTLLERAFNRLGLRRSVKMIVPTYLGVAELVATTNLIATVPLRMGEVLSRGNALRCMPLPFELPSYPVRQHWHQRHQHDPGHRWLRQSIGELFRGWRVQSPLRAAYTRHPSTAGAARRKSNQR